MSSAVISARFSQRVFRVKQYRLLSVGKGTTFFRLLQILKLKIVDNLKEFQQIPIPYILMYARSGIEGVMTGGIWERYGRDMGGMTGGMTKPRCLYVKGFWEIDGRGEAFFEKRCRFISRLSCSTKIVWQNLLNDSHFGNGMFPLWEHRSPSQGI